MKQQAVQFCDGCGKVRDDIGEGREAPRWVELREFQMTHGFKADDLLLTHTYCPECKECVQAASRKPGPAGSRSR